MNGQKFTNQTDKKVKSLHIIAIIIMGVLT